MATVTNIEISSTGQEFSIPGDFTPAQVVANYGASIPGIGGMDSTVSDIGDGVKLIVFRPKTGTKG